MSRNTRPVVMTNVLILGVAAAVLVPGSAAAASVSPGSIDRLVTVNDSRRFVGL